PSRTATGENNPAAADPYPAGCTRRRQPRPSPSDGPPSSPGRRRPPAPAAHPRASGGTTRPAHTGLAPGHPRSSSRPGSGHSRGSSRPHRSKSLLPGHHRELVHPPAAEPVTPQLMGCDQLGGGLRPDLVGDLG